MTEILLPTIEDVSRDEQKLLTELCSMLEDAAYDSNNRAMLLDISSTIAEWQNVPPADLCAWLQALRQPTDDLPDYEENGHRVPFFLG